MAQCPTCGSNVAETATVCTDCGMDIKGLTPAAAAPDAAAPVVAPSGNTASRAATGKVAPVAAAGADAAAAGLGKLTLRRNGTLTAENFPMGEQAVVGRFDPETGPVDVDLGRLPEAVYISRRHAEFRCEPAGKWFLKDLGAGNGTFRRPKGEAQFTRIRGETEVTDGDEIGFGNARFEFRVNGAPGA